MVVDSTLSFAARRHVPTRYSRDLVAKTLTAMQRVEEIRQRRERVFYLKRMSGNKANQLVADKKLVAENQHLLPPDQRTEVEAVQRRVEQMDVDSEEEEEDESEEEEKVVEKKQREKVKVPVKVGGRKKVRMDVD